MMRPSMWWLLLLAAALAVTPALAAEATGSVAGATVAQASELDRARTAAGDVRIGWRSPYGTARAVAVDISDGSCWAGAGTGVVHVSADGVLLSRTEGFKFPGWVSVDPRDGSCWVSDTVRNELVKVDRDGVVLFRLTSVEGPGQLSVNTGDGSCWVVDGAADEVVHLAADGTELWRGGGFVSPYGISASSGDGSCWVADMGSQEVVRLSAQGAELLRKSFSHWEGLLDTPQTVAAVPADGSCWVGLEAPSGYWTTASLVHVAADGTVVSESVGSSVGAVAVNTADSSCWSSWGWLMHSSATGDMLSETPAPQLWDLAVNPLDGSVWTAEPDTLGLVHRSQFGVLIDYVDLSGTPQALSDAGDGSFWVGIAGTWDAGLGEYVGALVQRVAPDGGVLASSSAFQNPKALGAVRSDASCWVADEATGEAVHLSSSGEELARVGGLAGPTAVSVDPYDHSVWVADTGNDRVVHLDASGSELSHSDGLLAPTAVSAYRELSSDDRICWVADTGHGEAVRLTSDGTADLRVGGFTRPVGIAGEGSFASFAKVADIEGHRVVRVAGGWADPVLWSNDSFTSPSALARGYTYTWVMDEAGEVAALHNDTGAVLWRGPVSHPTAIAANGDPISNYASPDSSVWVASGDQQRVYHYAGEGSVRWHGQTLRATGVPSAYGQDGSCWVAESGRPNFAHGAHGAVRVGPDGTRLAETPSMIVGWVRTDQTDGSAWVTKGPESGATAIAHISATGEVLSTWGSYQSAAVMDYNPHDETLWLVTNSPPQVLHLATDGTQLSASTGFSFPLCVSANSGDDTCWVTDITDNAVVHLASDGTEVERLTGLGHPLWVTVDPGDGSIWVTDNDHSASPPTGAVSHVAADGTVLWSSSAFGDPMQPALNRQDHSVWVADAQAGVVVHLAADGTELWRGDNFSNPMYLSIDPVDGSLWVSDPNAGEVTHLVTGLFADYSAQPRSGLAPLTVAFTDESSSSATSWAWDFGDGDTATGQNPTHVYERPGAFTVSLTVSDGAKSATEAKQGYVVVSFADVAGSFWAYDAILACAGAGIVAGYDDGTYRPDESVTRDQMAAYISRALAGGDADVQVPSGVAEPTFGDVGADHWAYRYIEYCAGAGIVQGYSDGTYHPEETVNRGQMAVYIARSIATPTGEAGVPGVPAGASPTFTDVTADNDWAWCYKHVEYCAAQGVVQGYTDGSYHPAEAVTRDQMAVYIQRAFQLPM